MSSASPTSSPVPTVQKDENCTLENCMSFCKSSWLGKKSHQLEFWVEKCDIQWWKKVNLDRKRKLDISRRAFGGGTVMIRGAIFANGKSQLAILERNQTAESYFKTSNGFLLLLISGGRRGTILYQQNNTTVHKAHLCNVSIVSKPFIGLPIVLIWILLIMSGVRWCSVSMKVELY